MAFDINGFLANGLIFGGQRPSKWDVQAVLPAAIGSSTGFATKLAFTCKAGSIPAFNLGLVELPYFGRKIKTAGDRVWDDWIIQVMCDEDMATRSVFEAWNNAINQLIGNKMIAGTDTSSTAAVTATTGVTAGVGLADISIEEAFKSTWTVNMYAKDDGGKSTISTGANVTGSPNRSYNLIGAWPRIIGPMTLNWEETNRIVEFQVTVSFDTLIPDFENNTNITAQGGLLYAQNVDS